MTGNTARVEVQTKEIQDDFLLETTNDFVVITGINIFLPNNDGLWAARDLIIRAAELILTQNVVLPGKNIYITCKKLILKNNITIDVSGKPGNNPPPPANNGIVAGAPGENGSAGAKGQAAGNITIMAEIIEGETLTCRANGGIGGKGQQGGNGARGENGLSGSDASGHPSHNDFVAGNIGQNGGKGGDAGQGGEGGKGGNSGKVSIHTINLVSTNKLIIENMPGLGGEFGANGEPGKGGLGGTGGKGVQWKCSSRPTGGPGGHGGDM